MNIEKIALICFLVLKNVRVADAPISNSTKGRKYKRDIPVFCANIIDKKDAMQKTTIGL